LVFGVWCFGVNFAFAAEIDKSKLPPPAARSIDFTRDIKPIFEKSCVRCHGTETAQEQVQSGHPRDCSQRRRKTGSTLFRATARTAPLIHYVARLVPEMEMPPDGKGDPLTREQISVLRTWIDQGVAWEQVDASAQYAAQFSFTPAVRWASVSWQRPEISGASMGAARVHRRRL
jgi:hypothetical protein